MAETMQIICDRFGFLHTFTFREQRDNLQTLATGLASRRRFRSIHFGMNSFEVKTECGTTACAAGFGPLITGHQRGFNENWGQYVFRVFGFTMQIQGYYWCFSAEWAKCDNTRLGAAKRIQYYLDGNELPRLSELTAYAKFVSLYKNTEVKK